jgi:transposase
MAKRTKKDDPQQKNKKGFDSAVLNAEFAHEMGSAASNKIHHDKAKKEKAAKNQGKWKGMH